MESNSSIAHCFKEDFFHSYLLYQYIHLILAICYGILCLLCVVHFFYKLYTAQATQTPWHNLFYPLLFIGSAVRGILMLSMYLPTPVHSTKPFILMTFTFTPSFIFFSAYLIILFRWAQIYHSSYEVSSLKYEHLRLIFYLVNALMYIVVISLFVADALFGDEDSNSVDADVCLQSNDPIQYTITALCTSLYILTPIGFSVYTFRITRKFRYLPARSPAKREISRRLLRFTTLVLIVFCFRAGFTAYSNIDHKSNMSIEYPWSDGVYYFLLEIVPLVLMFLILRMHSTKSSDSHSSGPSAVTPLINHPLPFA